MFATPTTPATPHSTPNYDGPPAPQYVYPDRVERIGCVGFINMFAAAVHAAIRASLERGGGDEDEEEDRRHAAKAVGLYLLPSHMGFAEAPVVAGDAEDDRQLDAIVAHEIARRAHERCSL